MLKASRDTRVVAFYGYKGGAGRSLLAANTSVLLSLIGKRVLLIDWDLEAPGVGDYFNGASDLIPQMWRTHHGLFELLVKCRRMPEGTDLRPTIREFLTAKDYRRPVLPVKFKDFQSEGSLEFIGPGRQVGPEFAAALMTSDWADFFLIHGEAFHKAFRDVVRDEEIGYDVVIIDTRTGYNLSTIFILRLLADIVYFVAPKTTQALLGISNVWKLIPSILGSSGDDKGSSTPRPEQRLILSRYRVNADMGLSEPKLSSDAALNYVKEALDQRPEEIFAFPALDGIADYEQLFLQDRTLRSIFFPRKGVPAQEDHNPSVIAFRDAFWRVCRDIGGIDPATFSWESVMPPALLEEEYVALRSELMPASTPQLEQGRGLVSEYFEEREGTVALASLQAWANRAAILDRATLGEIILRDERRTRSELFLNMPAVLKGQLFLDDREDRLESSGEAAYNHANYDQNDVDVTGPSPVPAMRTAAAGQHIPTPTTIIVPGVQPDQRRRATRLWMAANTARDQDDPMTAANHLAAAIKLLEEASHGPLSDSIRRDIANDLAIYEWNIAQVASDLGQWDVAYGHLVHLLQLQTLPDSRAIDDSKTVSRFDIWRFAISLCENRLRETGRPLSPQEMYRIGRLPSLLRNVAGSETPIRQINLELDLEKFSLAEAAVAPVKDESEIVRKLLRISELQNELRVISGSGSESRLSILADTCTSLSMAYRFSGDEHTLHKIEQAVTDGLALIDNWFGSGGSAPTSAPEQTLALASTLRNSLDRSVGAFAVAQDALQFLGNISDGRSEKVRIDILVLIGLLEQRLGRPDRAERTWSEIARLAGATDFPAGSHRRRQTGQMKWWMAAAAYERGEYEIASAELTKHEQNYLTVLESTDTSADDRASARICLASISSWLPDVAFHLGRFEDAVTLCGKWEEKIRKSYYFEVDAGRQLARCKLTLAETAFCLGDNNAALAAIREGMQHNHRTAEGFGGLFSVLQDKLVLLRSEITAFSSGTIDEHDALAALTRLESTCGRMLAEATSQGWYLVDLISISATFARAAATDLRLNNPGRAEFVANEVLTRWLDFLPRFERGNDSKWVTDLARTPRTMANAILANVRGEAGPIDNARAATEGISQMLPAERRRNAHIFALCGFEIAP